MALPAIRQAIRLSTQLPKACSASAIRHYATPPPSNSVPSSDAPLPPTTSAYSSAKGLALDFMPPDAPDEPRAPKSHAKAAHRMSSIDKKRQTAFRATMALAGAGVVLMGWHLGRDWDSEKERERTSNAPHGELDNRWSRTKSRTLDLMDYFNKPAWDPLLPPPLAPPHQKPYTLVLSLDDMLIHSEWSRDRGWKTAKRPGLDYFLAYLSQFYEIVLFTTQPSYTAIPIAEKIDPYMYLIPYKLFKDSTIYKDKGLIKDLSYLGRDLSKVVIMDTDPHHYKRQPRNAIPMKPWDGNVKDHGLIEMIPFLESLAIYAPPDVRNILDVYQDKNIPTEYAKVEAAERKAIREKWEAEEAKRVIPSFSISQVFGFSGNQAKPPGQPPKRYIDLEREKYQKAYLEEKKYWQDNEANIKKMMDDDREAQMRQMNSSVMGFFKAQFGGLAPPEEPKK